MPKKRKKRKVKRKKTVKKRVSRGKKTQLEKDMLAAEKTAEKTLELQDPHHWRPFIISVLVVFAIAFIGNSFTAPVVDSAWYESIKPAITPPNWVFPIVWNILFFLIAASMYLAWIHSKKGKKGIVAWEFGVNLFLNVLWSYLFFGLKQPLYAFFCLIFLWISILSMIYITYSINKKATYFLIPYLLWVSFAGVLNYLIII